jgi:magnesium/cobalt transport protein CorA
MKHQLRKLSAKGLEKVAFEDLESIDSNENYWLEIQADSRSKAIDFLSDLDLNEQLIGLVRDPSNITRVNIYGTDLLLDLVVSNTTDILQSEHLTIIARPHLLISILNAGNTLLKSLDEEVEINLFKVELNLFHLLYYILGEIFQQGMENLKDSRLKVKRLSEKIEQDPHAVDLTDIMQCKTEISTLDDIVEDQYNMLAFVPKINWTEESKLLRSDLKEQIHGLEYLKNSYERLIEKIDHIHSHYQLILQEKGNKRLNTLTVVQAIFVPNTFLAGIYGMNFSFMPELNWKYSYFVVLGIIMGISIFQLWWFKRKGWFS